MGSRQLRARCRCIGARSNDWVLDKQARFQGLDTWHLPIYMLAFRSLGRLGCFELEILNTRSLLSSDDLLTYCRDGVRVVVLSVSGFLKTKSG